MRYVEPIPCGNRFMVYALWPAQNISIWIINGFRNQNCVFACGHSVINRSCQTSIGPLMAKYGGGGHHAAGTCQIEHAQSERVLQELLSTMIEDEKSNSDQPEWIKLKAA
jgi:nanoRNase/pAp phosphatase (c-di-AMP/oligoRNAs hydrolase)